MNPTAGLMVPNSRFVRVLMAPALPVFCALTFLRFYVESPPLSMAITGVLVLYGLVLLGVALLQFSGDSAALYLMLVLFLTALSATVFGSNEALTAVPQFMAHMGFAAVLLCQKLRTRTFEWSFYFYSAIFFVYMAAGVDPEDVFSVSRNFVSVFVILTLSLYYISCQQNGDIPRVRLSLIGLVVTLWGIGRAGIGSLLMILLFTVFFTGQTLRAKIATALVLVVGTVVVMTSSAVDFGFLLTGLERFDRLGVEDVREEINAAYLARIGDDWYELFFGAPLNSIPEVMAVDGNPHNSYIRLHTNFGLVGFVVMLLAIFVSFARIVVLGKRLVSIVFVVVLFRSAFDVTAFYGPLDVILVYVVIYCFNSFRIVNFRFGAEDTKVRAIQER